MKSMNYLRSILVALCLILGSAPTSASPETLQSGIPVRVWLKALSGQEEQTTISYFDQIVAPSTPMGLGWSVVGLVNQGGTAMQVRRMYGLQSTYVQATLSASGAFQPWSIQPAGAQPGVVSDGAIEMAKNANTAAEQIDLDLGILRVVPGKTYVLNVGRTNIESGMLYLAPPPGYQAILNQMTRNACPLESEIKIRLVPASDRYAALAGFASSAASTGVSWRLALGSLMNGDSAGFIDLADAGISDDLSHLFSPGVLSYDTQAAEIFVHRQDGALRQVIANQVAVDVVTLAENTNPGVNSIGPRFELRCYSPTQVQSYVPCTFAGSPFVVYRIERRRPDPADATTVELQITRESRNLPNYTAVNVPIARTEVMILKRSGIAPGYHWSKLDWTQASQAVLVATTVKPNDSTPVIVRHPAGAKIVAGQPVTLSVAAVGSPVPTYQWYRNGSILAGKTSPSLSIPSVQAGDVGSYTVTASNSLGSVTSAGAALDLNTGGNPPFFVLQPSGEASAPGKQVLFEVTASGAAPISYQWKKNGTNISGATGSKLLLGNVQSADAGTYTVTITNGSGTATSANAVLAILAARTETFVVETPGGAASLKVSRGYTGLPSGEELTSETVGTTSPKVSSFSYFTDIAQPGSFGYVKSISSNSGSWEAYEYYDTSLSKGYQIGQVRFRFRPFQNQPATPTLDPSQGEVTYFEYDVDAHGARTRQKGIRSYLNGILVSRTEMTYEVSGNNVLQKRRDYTGATTFIDSGTLFSPENNPDAFLRGRVAAIDQPDGVRKAFAYERGAWNGSMFTPMSNNGLSSRITSVLGFSSSNTQYNGWANYFGNASIPLTYLFTGRSTAESVIRDERGLVVKTENFIWTGSAWQLVAWVKFDYNPAGLLINRVSSTGGVYSATYDGLLKTSETDESGNTTGYLYDAAGRVSTVTQAGAGAINSLSTRKTYNASGQVLEDRTGVGLAEQIVASKLYDLAGRVVSETAPGLAPVTYAYDVPGRSRTVTRPDGGTVVETQAIDGKIVSRSGTGTISEFLTYGVDATSGVTWAQTNKGTANSRRWQRTYKDWAGREIYAVAPTFESLATTFDGNFGASSVRVTRKFYNDTVPGTNLGKLVKITDTGVAPTLYEYDKLGRTFRTGLDLTGDGALNLASVDRISEAEESIELFEGAWWATAVTRTYAASSSATASVMSIKRTRLTGFPAGRLAETHETDVSGNITRTVSEVTRSTSTVVTTITTTGIGRPATEKKVLGFVTESVDFAGLKTSTAYDSLRRRWKVTDARGNVTTTAYVPGTNLTQSLTDDTGTIVSLRTYDNLGRVKSEAGAPDEAQPGSPRHMTYSGYDLRGNLVRTWGDAAIPVEYGFDPVLGDRTTMKTFRAGTGWDATTWPSPASTGTADTTTWNFDEATGLLKSKADALNRAVSYTYNPRGQLASRKWARGVVTLYAYDIGTAEQRDILYSDGTPALHYTYNRMGKTSHIEDVTGLRTQDHCLCGKLASEQLSYEFYGSRKLTYRINQSNVTSLGRTMGYALTAGSTIEQDVGYNYDPASGRFADLSTHTTFAAGDHHFYYSYLANSNMIERMVVDSGTTYRITRGFEENRDVLTSIDSQWNGVSRARFDYVTDKLGQRISRTQSGTVFADYGNSIYQTFGYDSKGQLTSDTSYLGTTAVAGNVLKDRRHEFAYDNIGNRQYSNVTGNFTIRDKYVVNALNQYESKENNVLAVSGTAASAVSVEVSGTGTISSGPGRYWSALLTPPNLLGPWRGAVNAFSGKAGAGAGGSALLRTDARLAHIPKALQTLAYDLDGNLIDDGMWNYAWDAENRLVRMTTTSAAVTGGFPNQRLEFRYDYLGRRIQKSVFDESSGQAINTKKFIYDGWNVIAEYAVAGSSTQLRRTFTWGLDIVHDLAKSGGVGALLQVSDCVTGKGYFPAYDGNGNVVALFDGVGSNGGTCVATYEYSQYGEAVRSEGTYANENPIRFSTKVTDHETGLVYFGRRYYDSKFGRFLGLDPTGERGGKNLYAFALNNPANRWDFLGMAPSGTPSVGQIFIEEITEDGKRYKLTWTAIGSGNEGDEPRWPDEPQEKDEILMLPRLDVTADVYPNPVLDLSVGFLVSDISIAPGDFAGIVNTLEPVNQKPNCDAYRRAVDDSTRRVNAATDAIRVTQSAVNGAISGNQLSVVGLEKAGKAFFLALPLAIANCSFGSVANPFCNTSAQAAASALAFISASLSSYATTSAAVDSGFAAMDAALVALRNAAADKSAAIDALRKCEAGG